jgi:hypothetical protein
MAILSPLTNKSKVESQKCRSVNSWRIAPKNTRGVRDQSQSDLAGRLLQIPSHSRGAGNDKMRRDHLASHYVSLSY